MSTNIQINSELANKLKALNRGSYTKTIEYLYNIHIKNLESLEERITKLESMMKQIPPKSKTKKVKDVVLNGMTREQHLANIEMGRSVVTEEQYKEYLV